jgi:thiamine pyrophosphokinase
VFFMPPSRAVIFANGQITDLRAARALIRPDDLLIAADGGARHAVQMGLTPQVVIGDLDSLTSSEVEILRKAGARILKFPVEKDETDLELAILHALAEGYRSLRILGALGGRIDQTLANLLLLALPGLEDLDARLDDGIEEVFLISPQTPAVVEGNPGEVLSLLPLGGPAKGITTHGLRYPLHDETLYPERSRGVSNELLTSSAQITLLEGKLICVHTRKVFSD